MRVAFIGIKGLPARGGAERVAEGIVTRLPAMGLSPTVYCDRAYTPADANFPGVKLIRIPAFAGKHLRSTTLDFFAALHALIIGKYDLIHLHNVEASFVLPFLRLRYKVVSTSHGTAYGRAKWGRLARRIIQWMDIPFVRLSSAVTFVSAKDAQDFRQRFGRETIYIPNGVGLEYEPDETSAMSILTQHGLTRGNFFIFVAGRIEPTKGAHTAIQAVNQMPLDHHLLVVGDLDQVPEYGQQLRSMASHRIHFQPLVEDRQTLFGLMSAAKALVFPSLFEAMSMVLLEAAALGVPIFCSDLTENQEVMKQDALYFSPTKPDELARLLAWGLSHGSELTQMAERAKNRIRNEYSWDLIVAKYVNLYHMALAQ